MRNIRLFEICMSSVTIINNILYYDLWSKYYMTFVVISDQGQS